tara:strand:+ start:181 stop:1023 length:843 start_codon:yes stop_codon:yes gene_type:complete
MSKSLTALIDLDAMLHIVANVQYSAGNRDRAMDVRNHIRSFVSNVCTNATNKEVILLYQQQGHTNFRNEILPEYKGHRVTSDAILCWKETILDEYKNLGAIGLQHIESDDAQSVLAEHLGYNNIVVVTSDKDMIQIPGLIYNPYKGSLKPEERWQNVSIYEANRFFWKQVLTGDPTDMPSELCGIEGVGMVKAEKMVDNDEPFLTTIQREYSKKYGQLGFSRANVTYKMVRLLRTQDNEYINEDAKKEIQHIIDNVESFKLPVTSSTAMFENPNPLNLFL